MSAISITKNNFQEVISSKQPVLIDFWAPWCMPCKMFAPVVEEVAQENAGQVAVGKINIDEEPELAAQFGVMSIPTLILMKSGRPVASTVGAQPKAAVQRMIDSL
ncbi:thioredoxin [Intestinibacillus massiliensis]|uniref:thioredoxin n=1 Tax=Intestinibacillus massiliensis TaxID=1871029 RepID=UPI000B34B62D|nr:thioredoxin [Intestinibacillus massiliensis]MCB6364626.1 thioredoxin [Intestinibacillus massiliensis]